MTHYLGTYELQGAVLIQSSKAVGAISKGDVLVKDTDGKLMTADSAGNNVGPFGVATKDAASDATTVQEIVEGIVYVTADGVIAPNSFVACSTITDGRVVAFTALDPETTAVTGDIIEASEENRQIVGVYLRHADEGDGYTIPTDAAQGDEIAILLGGA
jgi:hypothetical protein